MLAEMETKLCAARALLYQTAYRKDRGEDTGKDAAMAKFYAAETAMEVATKALQLHGGYGYMKDYPIERMFRDAVSPRSTRDLAGPADGHSLIPAQVAGIRQRAHRKEVA
jgi:alkylation response protein AidB-like acyl-CoA dehydrogenase